MPGVTQYGVITPDKQSFAQTLYDTRTYPETGVDMLQFFTQGEGGVQDGVTKTKFETNMTQGGRLTSDKSFYIKLIEVIIIPSVAPFGETALDYGLTMWTLGMSTSRGELKIIDKTYDEDVLVASFPGNVGLSGFASGDVSSLYASYSYRSHEVNPPKLLSPNQDFSFSLLWKNAPTLGTGITAKIITRMYGLYVRPAQ